MYPLKLYLLLQKKMEFRLLLTLDEDNNNNTTNNRTDRKILLFKMRFLIINHQASHLHFECCLIIYRVLKTWITFNSHLYRQKPSYPVVFNNYPEDIFRSSTISMISLFPRVSKIFWTIRQRNLIFLIPLLTIVFPWILSINSISSYK